jgi:hypothetical protein
MLDREKVVSVLKRRFPDSTTAQVAAAANAIVGLEDEWMELPLMPGGDIGICRNGCFLQQVLQGREIRVFSRGHTKET